ncbi:hypothetical protein [Hydrogenophaga sp. RWCD_12]|uniref:hypothetical protein n=1 Tax=Hydrogenophaga sp. RWCD_12 TaxID=3391190 RepID=UPI00398464FC
MDHNQLNRLASGRSIVHFCLFGWLGMFAFQLFGTPVFAPLLLILTVAAIGGSLKVARALDLPPFVRFASVLGAALPIAGLLVMGWLSSKARRELLTAGWRLGAFRSYQ